MIKKLKYAVPYFGCTFVCGIDPLGKNEYEPVPFEVSHITM